MADQDFILAPATVTVSFATAPVYNIINSMLCLNEGDGMVGFHEWVTETRARIPSDVLQTNRLVFETLSEGMYPNLEFATFPEYVDYIESLDPVEYRDEVLEKFGRWCDEQDIDVETDPKLLLNDRMAFLKVVEETIVRKHAEKGYDTDLKLYVDAHRLLNEPAQMLNLIVRHLRRMWTEYVEPEWKRVLPIVTDSVNAFQQMNYSGMTALEAIRTVTGRDMSQSWEFAEKYPKIVFIPSAHIGPYLRLFPIEDTAYLMFGARVPEGVKSQSLALSRSELLVRLNALADDTRLTILELLTQHHELCAQDIINMLDLSQSSASRHLRQLTATGYIVERRRDIAKCYTLNYDRLEDTVSAVQRFLHR
jgi:ArsR family transcriptional regulator